MESTAARVALSAICNMILGMVWYSEGAGFGKIWMRGHGLTREKIEARNAGAQPMVVAMASGIVQSFFADRILTMAAAGSVLGVSAQLAILGEIWLAFTFVAIAMHYVFVTPYWSSVLLVDSFYHVAQLVALVLIRTYII